MPSESNNPTGSHELLNAYLDGSLPSEQVAAFEQALQEDPQLQREIDLQSEIDASLVRSFAAPALPADFFQRVEQAAQQHPAAPSAELATESQVVDRDRRKKRRMIFAAIAAGIAWVVVGWSVYQNATEDGYQQLALQDIYESKVASGFEPDWVCSDDRQFAETFQQRQGQALLLKPIPEGSMAGLAYLKGLTRRTTAMLAYVEQQPVLVFVERLERDTQPAKPSWWSGLQMFRKELGDLVLYEVTPLAEPRVIDQFYPVDELPAAIDKNPAVVE